MIDDQDYLRDIRSLLEDIDATLRWGKTVVTTFVVWPAIIAFAVGLYLLAVKL